MGVQERRARQKENIREEILDAARALFVKEGYERVSIRKIAEKIEELKIQEKVLQAQLDQLERYKDLRRHQWSPMRAQSVPSRCAK